MSLLITILVVAAIISVAWWAVQSMDLPPPARILVVLVTAIVCLYLLVGLLPHGHVTLP